MNLFYSPAYTQSLTVFDTTRKAGWIADSLLIDPIAGVTLVAPIPLTAEQLRPVHTMNYVNALRTGQPAALAGSSGFDWDEHTFASVCASNGGVLQAVWDALAYKRNTGSLSSGLHHAYAGYGGGFCTVNGLAVAAHAVHPHRVLILDLDAHCGGGTYSLIKQLPNVTHLDISTSVFDEYIVELSNEPSLSTFDFVDNPDAYFRLLTDRLSGLDRISYDVVVYNAGVDVYPLLGVKDIQIREHLVFTWAKSRGIPVAFVMAGGYTGDLTQAQLVRLHRLTIEAASA